MKYLIEIDGKLYGYDTMQVLAIDLATNKPDKFFVWERTAEKLRTVYAPIDKVDAINATEKDDQ